MTQNTNDIHFSSTPIRVERVNVVIVIELYDGTGLLFYHFDIWEKIHI